MKKILTLSLFTLSTTVFAQGAADFQKKFNKQYEAQRNQGNSRVAAGCKRQIAGSIKQCNSLLKTFMKQKMAPKNTAMSLTSTKQGFTTTCKDKKSLASLKKLDKCIAAIKKLEK